MVYEEHQEPGVKKIQLKYFDFFLVVTNIILIFIGILFIYSSNITSVGVVFSKEYLKQILWAISGLGIFFLLSLYPYERLKTISAYLYLLSILLLILTLIIGKEVNGARSWIGFSDIGIQPSEFTKIAVILFLSSYISNTGEKIREIKHFLIALAITGIPAMLILLQPDFGTALVYLPVFLFVAFVGGSRIDHILFILLTIILTGTLVSISAFKDIVVSNTHFLFHFLDDSEVMFYVALSLLLVLLLAIIGYLFLKRKYFYWVIYSAGLFLLSMGATKLALRIMKNYQIMRLIIFLKPEIDPRGSGWNIIQSVTAVGSGGFWGKGFLHGTQSHYRYLPQQSTDFIFSILAEEWGFIGCVLVLTLFSILLIRGLFVAYKTKDTWATLVGSGIIGMIFFHVIINIGMAIGVMPITGIPLFFLSYGGSSLWTGLIGMAIINSMHIHQKITTV